MTDIATLRLNLDALKATLRSGTLRTRFGDREVWYRSESEIRVIIASLENDIAALEGTPVVRNIAIRSKGWS
jgi:hypothetical protein